LKCRVRSVGCRTVNYGIANLKKFATITEYLFLQIDDNSLFKTEIIKNRKTKEFQKNYIALSELLFTTSKSLIDFCETDDINVAGLTKVALYILDRFYAQWIDSPHKSLIGWNIQYRLIRIYALSRTSTALRCLWS
jgi:hypothetical protein